MVFIGDDSDLIDKAVIWAKKSPSIKQGFLKLHPRLKERLEIALDQADSKNL